MNFTVLYRQLKIAVVSVSAGGLLAGCAATVDPGEQIARDRLDQARAAYTQAKANPIVESYSLKTLLEAEKTLQDAEKVTKKLSSPIHSIRRAAMIPAKRSACMMISHAWPTCRSANHRPR